MEKPNQTLSTALEQVSKLLVGEEAGRHLREKTLNLERGSIPFLFLAQTPSCVEENNFSVISPFLFLSRDHVCVQQNKALQCS